jgi:NADH-quinone oxidoreductase subunit C
MSREEILNAMKSRFAADIEGIVEKSARRAYVEIKPRALPAVASYLFRELGARFNTASGVDARDHIQILYHFSLEGSDLLVSLRVKLDRQRPEVDSLAPLIKGANWVEREIHELLGVVFRGHPGLKRLLLPEEWPEGVHPLRRDYAEWDPQAVRDRGV